MTASELRELRRRARRSGVRTPAALSRESAAPAAPTASIAPSLPAARPVARGKMPFFQRRFAWTGLLSSDYVPSRLT
ncbi:MAG: hypothetical protein JSR82_20050 [Verrucomicrobia bacterium]|nr:hypothetical protein [Verrucomicrobiota bacterium]